jgi:hypothetical protein
LQIEKLPWLGSLQNAQGRLIFAHHFYPSVWPQILLEDSQRMKGDLQLPDLTRQGLIHYTVIEELVEGFIRILRMLYYEIF